MTDVLTHKLSQILQLQMHQPPNFQNTIMYITLQLKIIAFSDQFLIGLFTHHGQIKFKYKVVHHEKDLSNLKVDPLRVPKK